MGVAFFQSVFCADTLTPERATSEIQEVISSTTSATILTQPAIQDAFELPAVRVDATKAPPPSKSDVLTKAGLSEYFLKRYPGASRKGQDPTDHYVAGPPNYALVMYRDDQRLSRLQSLKHLGAIVEISGDREGAKSLKSEVDRAFIRRPTPVNDAMDRSVNLWLRK